MEISRAVCRDKLLLWLMPQIAASLHVINPVGHIECPNRVDDMPSLKSEYSTMMLYDEFVERRDSELTCKFPSVRQEDVNYEDFCVDEYTSYVEAYVHASREALNRMPNSAQLIGEPAMEYQEVALADNEIPY